MYNFKKKILSSLCIAACLLTTAVPAALAVDMPTLMSDSTVTAYMTYINNADSYVAINDGRVYANAVVFGYRGQTTKSSVTVELQEKGLITWKTIGTWSATESDYRASVEGSQPAESGKTYRAKASVTVWSGSNSETKTVTSPTVTAK